jgi:glycosyltransferase involved in cell wall biosynthesis
MDDPLVTVLVPSHDHGDLIEFALRSVLNQTLQDFEVLVVGDGMTDEGRACVSRLAAKDPRVRLFDLPKGPRHGEVHRHRVLTAEARGRIVCYLSDDDLFLPRHLEAMVTALRESDFAYALPNFITIQREYGVPEGDLSIPEIRERLTRDSDFNFIAFHGAAHTMALYRRLPFGWRTTPLGRPTDLYMWQQILSVPGCRVAMSPYATTLHFPDAGRRGWTHEERRAELAEWEERVLARPDGELLLASMAIARLVWSRTHMGLRIGELERSRG